MTDGVRQSQTSIDIGNDNASLVTLDVVSSRFIAAGLPRSMRTLQRYCAAGTLECIKEATETGDTYFVVEPSIGTAITALKQLHDAKDRPRHAATERAVTLPVDLDDTQQNQIDGDVHRPTASADDASERIERQTSPTADTSRYVAQLEARLDEKDEEIEFLREELIDRRGQIRDMKGIIDGQNQLLETIQTNVAPIFNALAATVKSSGISLANGGEPRSSDFQQPAQRDDRTPDGLQNPHDGPA
jgi:uncharacterized membrane protein YdfJ with MMPL/SSD domain